jgi:hypothetical protein
MPRPPNQTKARNHSGQSLASPHKPALVAGTLPLVRGIGRCGLSFKVGPRLSALPMYPETRELTFAIGGRNRMISMGYFFRFVYQNAVGAGKRPRPLVAQRCVPHGVPMGLNTPEAKGWARSPTHVAAAVRNLIGAVMTQRSSLSPALAVAVAVAEVTAPGLL